MRIGNLFLLLALLVVSGCRTSALDAAATSLDALPAGSDWALQASDAPGLELPEAGAIRLHVEADRLSGDSGCNRFSTGYALKAGRIEIGPVAATKRGCMSPQGEIEQSLFRLLPAIESASMEGETLVLRAGDGASLRFVPAAPIE